MNSQERSLLRPHLAGIGSFRMPAAEDKEEELITIRDGSEPLILVRKEVNGVVVLTPSKEKSCELDLRFQKMVERTPTTTSSRPR